MGGKKKLRKLACLLLAIGLVLALAGCNKQLNNLGEEDEGYAQVPEEEPVGFVDNEIDPGEYSDEELYFTDPDKNAVIGVKDETVYYNGTSFNLRFAVNMITSNSGDKSVGLAAGAIKDRVDFVRLGDKTYGLDQIVRSRTAGFEVLSMLSADFGIDIYALDENNEVVLAECAGKDLAGEELRSAYSERADFEDYTVLVYYIHAQMNGMDAGEYNKCRELLGEKYGIDHSSLLDGTLAVMLYYDVNGYDIFYAIAAASPGYWTDSKDFEANMENSVRHDITNCCMVMTDGTPVGFVNQVFIRCDQDVPFANSDGTIPDDGNVDEDNVDGDTEDGEDVPTEIQPRDDDDTGDAGTEDE